MIRYLFTFLIWIGLSFSPGIYSPSYIYAEASSTSTTTTTQTNKEFVPPFSGGPITGWWGEQRKTHKHAGMDIGGDDFAIVAPVDGYVWHKNAMEDSYGEGIAYFESLDNPLGIPIRLLFADLDGTTANMASGPVKKGDVIGYVRGFVEPSSGAHVHINEYIVSPTDPYAPYWNFESGNTRDPRDLLEVLGCDFSGTDYSGPNAGRIGSDNPEVYFDLEILKTLGDEINKIIKDWSQHAIDAVKYITPYALYLLGVLCIIDLALPILLSGMSFDVNKLITKIIRYAAIFGLVYAWPKFINDILLSFITSIGGAINSDLPITENVTQPQLLLQKAIYVIGPAFTKIGTFTTKEWLTNFGAILGIYAITFLVVIVYAMAAIYVALAYIEFYISAGLSLVSVPFTSWRMANFIPEGLGGHLISSAFKLLIVSILIGMGSLAIKDARPVDIFKVPTLPAADTNVIDKDPDVGAGLASTNEYVGMIKRIAQQYNVDPALALAIAARESGGDNVDDICMPTNGDGIFQVNKGQDGYDPVSGEYIMIEDRFPNYKTDPAQNTEAAMMILLSKINRANGDIWIGVMNYNGSNDKEWYLQRVKRNYELISGHSSSTVGHTGISAPMLVMYLKIALALITIALLVMIIPGRFLKVLGGPLEFRPQ